MTQKLYSQLTHLYPLSKTLRFELQPIGKTQDYFEKDFLKTDEKRAEKFKTVKNYCDEYHQYFIENCLNHYNGEDLKPFLEEYYDLFKKKERTDKEEEKIEKLQEAMRKTIAEIFSKNKDFKGIFDKDFIGKLLKEFIKEKYPNDAEKLQEIEFFNKFTVYFTGYNENRKNIYTAEAIPTAIAHRLINENLAIFIKNLECFDKVLKIYPQIKEELQKELNICTEDYLTDIQSFIKVLSQSQIETYNLMIAGKFLNENKKLKGLNELINLYNQHHPDSPKLPKLKELYKQILSDKTSTSFVRTPIQNDAEMMDAIRGYCSQVSEELEDIRLAFENIHQFNLNEVFVESKHFTKIAQAVFNDWGYIHSLLEKEFLKNNPQKESPEKQVGSIPFSLESETLKNKLKKERERSEKYLERKEEFIKKIKILSIQKIEDLTVEWDSENKGKWGEYLKKEIGDLILNINQAQKSSSELLKEVYEKGEKKLINEQNKIDQIKELLDSYKALQDFVKIFIPRDSSYIPPIEFGEKLHYESLSAIIPLYNRVRNYLTQKPYQLEKFPLTFNNPTLCDGWDLNKEKDNLGILFKKEEAYYLGIMHKKHNKIFEKVILCAQKEQKENAYQKIEYKLLPGPNKMLPKVFFSKSRIAEFNPSEELLEKYNLGCHKKGEYFDLNFCHQLIDFFKQSIAKHEDWKHFNFQFSETASYEDISAFYKEVQQQGYKINFKNISADYIEKLVEEGKLFLFQIYNKDFSPKSKGTPNMHTLYFKTVFDEANLKNVVFQLNGGAELFYRKKSLELKITHPKNQAIKCKNALHLEKEKTFVYDLIKDKRFTTDKFFFHVPITLNFKAPDAKNINHLVNNYIRENKDRKDLHIIGIDRGERNLLYVSVINTKGEIIKQINLNEIVNEYAGKSYTTDYHSLLSKRETERDQARKNWKTIGNIKELKEGYLSQVVHKIVALMVEYNAIVVLEDLNSGFKNSRKKVEKSVYDKFEKMLQNKLSFTVDKKLNQSEQGGLLNAYQLVNKKSLGRQSGVLFYIPAWNTSKIDPTTGFVNLFSIKETSKKAGVEFIQKIKEIRFNQQYFEFDIDYSQFTEKPYGGKKNWTLCSYGNRIKTSKNKNAQWESVEINLTKEFQQLFQKYAIRLEYIKEDILNQTDKEFFQQFFVLFKLMLQMRNSMSNSAVDYIISPVKNEKGEFYDSNKGKPNFPLDADANGAYNIARKGLILIERIQQTSSGEKINYAIKNQDWLEYAQTHCLG